MSKCMTIDEAIDQTDTCTELTAKNIVEIILEEVLHSVVIVSDKGCNRIGDFNISEDFCQQFDQVPAYSKEYQRDQKEVSSSQNFPGPTQDICLDSGEIIDHSVSLLTAKENLEFIIDSLVKKDEKIKNVNECKIITEEILADSELRIENGQIHIERNKSEEVNKCFLEAARQEYFQKKDIIKDEKIEIEYINEGKINKIYVPLSNVSARDSSDVTTSGKTSQEKNIPEIKGSSSKKPEEKVADDKDKDKFEYMTINSEELGRPFPPYTTEMLRQVWGSVNSSIVGGWDGDMSTQPEEVVRLMEELSAVQVFSDTSGDPNRPRACAFGEDDVRKMIKEIEEINFNQCPNPDETDITFHPDGQGDADLESKSFTAKSKDDMESSLRQEKDIDENEESFNWDFGVKLSPEKSVENIEKSPWNYREDLESNVRPTIDLIDTENIFATKNDASSEYSRSSNNPIHNVKNANLEKEYVPEKEALSNEREYDNQQDNAIDGINLSGSSNSQESLNEKDRTKMQSALSYIITEKKSPDMVHNVINEGVIFLSNSNKLTESIPRDLPLNSMLHSEISGGTIRRSQSSNKQLELSQEESRLLTEKDLDNLRGSLSLNNTSNCSAVNTQMFPDKDNRKSHHSDKEVEIFSLGSNFFLQKATELSGSESTAEETANSAGEECSINTVTLQSVVTDVPEFSESNVPAGKGEETTDKGTSKESKNENKPKIYVPEAKLFSEKSEDFVRNIRNTSFESDEFSGDPLVLSRKINNNAEESLPGSQDTTTPLKNEEKEIKNNKYQLSSTSNTNTGEKDTKDPRKESHEKSSCSNLGANETNEGGGSDPRETGIKKSSEVLLKGSGSQESQGGSPKESDENVNPVEEVSSSCLPEKFKLHSQKMCSGVDFDPACHGGIEVSLTASEEAFIDEAENVIQIINPPSTDNISSEDSTKISFCLVDEVDEKRFSTQQIITAESCSSVISNNGSPLRESESTRTKKVFSGMTTIGPMKNVDYDPKEIGGADIDFGKMRRITSSRQLAKDIFGTELNKVPSVKILQEDDSDEDSVNNDVERLEVGSLVNRDIASLTKVQKVREVMSYQPKPDEEFEEDDNLTRGRLDLKDVESMTDERYKVPDVSIPLLSFEVGDNNPETDKDFMQSMHLVLSRNCFNNASFYDEDEENTQNNTTLGNDYVRLTESVPDETLQSSISETKEVLNKPFEFSLNDKRSSKKIVSDEIDDIQEQNSKSESHYDGLPSHPKYGTLSGVFRKASNKFIRKDNDLCLRNSKSLPRDTSKLTASDSIRSILDDCHTSATNVLKKSRSLLKNTQTIFKTISQNRFNIHDSPKIFEKQKTSPSESDVNNVERKLSFLRKEDFTKAKNLIKNKVEKTFKGVDGTNSPRNESDISSDKKDLRVMLRNEENYRVDRMENFRKLLPKSPLVYKSQFVKSQASVQSNTENADVVTECKEMDLEQNHMEGNSKILLSKEDSEKHLKEEAGNMNMRGDRTVGTLSITQSNKETEIFFEEKLSEEKITWISEQGSLYQMSALTEYDPPQPEYIVMETVQGLPNPDLDTTSYVIETAKEKIPEIVAFENKRVPQRREYPETNRMDLTKEYHMPLSVRSEGICENTTYASDKEEGKGVSKTPSERKVRKKNKKFTARFRNFWCSAFGRTKTSPKKGDPS